MKTITMFDSIDVSQIPAQAGAVAGYLNGRWVTLPKLQREFPAAHRLSITVTASADADCLDVENGDATVTQAPGWVKRQLARGLYRPVVYAQASTMGTLLAALEAAGITRASVRLWSAHYTTQHICAPGSCGYPGVPRCHGTQWTSSALGRDLDESLLLADFFDPRPAPKPKPREDPVQLFTGQGATTAIAFRNGESLVRFFPAVADETDLSVEFNGKPTKTVKLTGGAASVEIPTGALGCRVVRRAAGATVAVSAVVE